MNIILPLLIFIMLILPWIAVKNIDNNPEITLTLLKVLIGLNVLILMYFFYNKPCVYIKGGIEFSMCDWNPISFSVLAIVNIILLGFAIKDPTTSSKFIYSSFGVSCLYLLLFLLKDYLVVTKWG